MNLLFISHFFPPEMGGSSTRIGGLTRNLAAFGHRVSVITGFPNYPSGVIPKGYRGKLVEREVIDGVEVHRTLVYASSRKTAFSRLANYFSFMLSSILQGFLIGGRYDVVIATSPPLFVGISGYIISRVKRAPLVFDVRDIWPQIGVDVGELQEGSLAVRMAEWLERFLYRNSRKITVVTEAKRDKLIRKGVRADKVVVIPNGVDAQFLDREVDEHIVKKYGLGDHFVATYAGLIGIAQGVDIITRAAEDLKACSEIKFLIIGDGVEREQMVSLARERHLTNVTFIPEQPKERISCFLKSSHVSIVPLKNSKLSDSVPSKMLESMALGCPVILCAAGESKEILEQAAGGIAVKPEEPEKLALAIMRLYENPQLREAYAENGRRYVLDHFSREKIARELETLLKGLIDA